jgi:hypothetical protein
VQKCCVLPVRIETRPAGPRPNGEVLVACRPPAGYGRCVPGFRSLAQATRHRRAIIRRAGGGPEHDGPHRRVELCSR